jgi:hypothetical protein
MQFTTKTLRTLSFTKKCVGICELCGLFLGELCEKGTSLKGQEVEMHAKGKRERCHL